MADYNSGGFHQGDDGTIFGSPDGSSSGSINDYDNWDWKQIKAAITGMSAGVATDANESHARAVADPQSLLDAANAFFHVQRTLEGITKSLVDQAKALAGDNGPWNGAAADAFHDMMTNFSRQVKANADVLAGGSTGDRSVPHQLANNAITLQSARNKLGEIDTWYADQAIAMGVTPMSNGLIPISQKPELVAMMNEDMRSVLKSLAHTYQVTTDTIVNPVPVNSPANNPNGPGTGDGPPDEGPDLGGPDGGIGDTGSLSELSGMPDTGLDKGLDTGGGIGGLDGLDPAGGVAGFPGDPSALDGAGLDGTGLDGTGLDPAGLDDLGLDGLDPSALDNALNPLSFPGLAGLGGLGGLGTGRLGSGKGAFDGLSTADPEAFGDTGLTDGLSDGLTGGLDSGLADGLAAGSGMPSQLATSSGMPYMPGMGGTGQGGGLSSEPTDASGLLDASGDPWEGEALTGGDDVGSELGASAGGEGLTTGGMPYMPGMGGMGTGGAGRDATSERTDASGLLDESAEPWEGGEDTGTDEVGSAEGALPGVPYLPGFGAPGTTARGSRTGAGEDGATVSGREEGERAGESAAAEPAVAPEAGSAAPVTAPAPVAVGSDGLPVSGDDGSAVVPRPVTDDGEEDFSAWEAGAGAGAFVPLLWAVRGERESREASEEERQGPASEPLSTWQPERQAPGAQSAAQVVRGAAGCGDGGPEPEAPDDASEEPEEEAEETGRGIADLLVQEESTWGTVPDGPAAMY